MHLEHDGQPAGVVLLTDDRAQGSVDVGIRRLCRARCARGGLLPREAGRLRGSDAATPSGVGRVDHA